MSQPAARPWWAEVEHLREPLERRRSVAPTHGQARSGPRARSEERWGAPAPGAVDPGAAGGPPGRRTVVIRGHAIPAVSARPLVEVQRRRPPRRAVERLPGKPDRVAMWAVMLGGVLLAAAALTGHA